MAMTFTNLITLGAPRRAVLELDGVRYEMQALNVEIRNEPMINDTIVTKIKLEGYTTDKFSFVPSPRTVREEPEQQDPVPKNEGKIRVIYLED